MPLYLDPEGCEYVDLDLSVDADPATATATLRVTTDGTDADHAMTWKAAAVESDGTYTRSASLLVAGPDATPPATPADVTLTAGYHRVAWMVTLGDEVIVRGASAITVQKSP